MKVVSQVFLTKVVDYTLKFAAGVIIARLLGPSDKGVLAFASLVVGWTVTFGNLSFMDANIFLLSSRRYSAEQASLTSFVLSLGSGLLYAVILFVLVFSQIVSWPVDRPVAFYLLLITVPFTIMQNNSIGILQGLGLFKIYNQFTVLNSLGLLLAVLIMPQFVADQLIGVVCAIVAVYTVGSLCLALYIANYVGWRLAFSFDYLRTGLSYGLRAYLRVLFFEVTARFDQFALAVVLGPLHLGWYSVAAALKEGLLLVPESVSIVLFPKVSGNQNQAPTLAARACRCTWTVMAVAAVITGVAGHTVIGLFYGEAFLPAAQPLYWLLAGMVFQSVSRVLHNYYFGLDRPQMAFWSSGASALTMVALTFPLATHFGMVGAAAAGLAARAVGAVIDLGLARRLAGMPVSEFVVPRKADLSVAAGK